MSNIVIKKAAVWLPETFEDSAFIASQTGVPEKVVREKMGIVRKCRASSDIHPGDMAVRAAKKVLKNIDPLSVDMVIWTGSEYKDYVVWTAGIYVQRELGLKNAHAFDISARCGNKILGLHLAKSLMLTNPNLKRVLLCGGHRTGDLVNYKDPNARFLNNLSDGGSAMLLERGDTNLLLECSMITDGDFTHDVIVPAGGTKNPTRNNPKLEDTFLQVPDMEGMRVRLEQRSMQNFLKVIKEASSRSMNKPIDYLALLHMKKSAHDTIVQGCELKPNQSIYLDHYGHFGAPDQVLSLGLAEKRGLLKKGDHVVFASAGIGYMWNAMSMKWDENTFDLNDLVDLGQ
jgi:3-oxoacyl-[acyl-carrier-protein] synthase-3